MASEIDLGQAVGKYAALRAAVAFSKGMLGQFRAALREQLGEPGERSPFVAVSGSLARLEASASSDIDSMVVFPSPTPDDAVEQVKRISTILGSVKAQAANGLAAPNPEGVFGAAVDGDRLVALIGARKEDYDNISRRLLLLLESQALWNVKYFESLRDDLVTVYARDVEEDESKHLVLLLNDLVRYFRTICVNYHNTKANERGKWPIRNVKLRHSRVLMYTSLLYGLGEISKYEHAHSKMRPHKARLLREYVAMTPLERFISLYSSNADDNLFRFLALYNNFLSAMADPATRTELRDLDYEKRYESQVFSSLKANSDAFAAELLRFLNARRGTWSDRFFEYLIL